MAEPKEQEDEKPKGYVRLPHNWQLLESGKMVDTLMNAYGNAVDEVIGVLKIEANKIKRILNSNRVHNKKLTEKKLTNLERAKQTIMRGGA